jgi:hypothetical protein
MRKSPLLLFLLIACFAKKASAQIDVFYALDNKTYQYEPPIGFGSFLQFSFPVNDGDEVSAECDIYVWDGTDAFYVPVKLGYLYTFSRDGSGWFAEGQAGYSFAGERLDKAGYAGSSLKGPVTTLYAGYRFPIGERFHLNLGFRIETVFSKSGVLPTAGFRASFPLVFGRR